MGHIVLVEDDAALAYAVSRLLAHDGYTVATFTDPLAAWDDLKSNLRPGLLLTDIRFPVSKPSGIALANHARARHRSLPVIYMTGTRNSQR